MEKQLLEFVKEKELFKKQDQLLLAISGGVDSVVLLHLLTKLGYKAGLAHCNFQLRAHESDADEKFVSLLAKKNNLPVYTERFNTNAHAAAKKISIQMAARELRYDFFERIRKKHGYKYVVTAHHATDNLETILINMLRGSGIKAMAGITAKNNNIVRPLLFATKSEIENYAINNKLIWREDESNHEDDYIRNKLRHHVLPVFKEINPSVERTFLKHSNHLLDAYLVIQDYSINLPKFLFRATNEGFNVQLRQLKTFKLPETIWYEMFKDYNFSPDTIHKLYLSPLKPGKVFFSDTHRLLIDRDTGYLTSINKPYSVEEVIIKPGKFRFEDITIHIKEVSLKKISLEKVKKNVNKKLAFFDAGMLKFPLTIRNFKTGDYFYPIGMKGKKLISDYFTDSKFTTLQKEKQLLLLSDQKIAWVIGHRASEKFKIKALTKSIYQVEVIFHDR